MQRGYQAKRAVRWAPSIQSPPANHPVHMLTTFVVYSIYLGLIALLGLAIYATR